MAAEPLDECMKDYKYLFDKDLLKGKVAFITGGGSGIGFTITEILMRHGCDTAIASRKLERVETAAAKLRAATGRKCLALQMDVRKGADVLSTVDKIMAEYGKIDILINNAAGNFLSPITGLSFNAYKTVLEIDTMGTFNVSKTVYEKSLMKNGGVVVNISATLPYKGTVLQAHAGSAKAAIDALTKHMAVEWGPNVRVVGVAPGPIANTEGMSRLGGRAKEAAAWAINIIPLERWGKKAEIGHTVLFLASEAGGYITGETVVADGGAWLTGMNSLSQRMEVMRSQQSKI